MVSWPLAEGQGPGQHATGGSCGEAEHLAGAGGQGAAPGAWPLLHQVGRDCSPVKPTRKSEPQTPKDPHGVA